jgi:hypothetical protein
MNSRVELKGLKELAATLGEIRTSVRTRVLKPAINSALSPVAKAVKAELPPGLARKSIGKKVYASRGKVGGLVGARTGFAQMVTRDDGSVVREDPAKILHLIESGRAAISIVNKKTLKSGGTGPGKFYGSSVRAAAGTHPLAKGWVASKDKAAGIVAVRIMELLAKIAKSKRK